MSLVEEQFRMQRKGRGGTILKDQHKSQSSGSRRKKGGRKHNVTLTANYIAAHVFIKAGIKVCSSVLDKPKSQDSTACG